MKEGKKKAPSAPLLYSSGSLVVEGEGEKKRAVIEWESSREYVSGDRGTVACGFRRERGEVEGLRVEGKEAKAEKEKKGKGKERKRGDEDLVCVVTEREEKLFLSCPHHSLGIIIDKKHAFLYPFSLSFFEFRCHVIIE